ncbi:MAG: recombinase RecA [Pirellulales bacterium]|nr:recombinase RecA [Pirellulales bacterium]
MSAAEGTRTTAERLSTGDPALDKHLGGGLLPGTLTLLVGATGIGKTQLGLRFADAGRSQEGRRGIVFDMTQRGDAQGHVAYAEKLCDWQLRPAAANSRPGAAELFGAAGQPPDYLHVFDYRGPKFDTGSHAFDEYHTWRQELVAKLDTAIAFFYVNFARGTRRVVIDGIDPTHEPSESIQFALFEYVYQQILRKECDWVARDLLRHEYRRYERDVAAMRYEHREIGCAMLYTSSETMLDALVERPLVPGDWLANANTVIYLGRVRDGNRVGRALHIAKHRGSYATDEILPYEITDRGLRLL